MRTSSEIVAEVLQNDPKKQRVVQTERELEKRRVDALNRIAEAGRKFLDLGNSISDPEKLKTRLEVARDSRVSLAEAYAVLSETGDFDSYLVWIVIGNNTPPPLWKGYVVSRPISKNFIKNDETDPVFYIVNKDCTGAFVCNFNNEAIGYSKTSPEESFENAKAAFLVICKEGIKEKTKKWTM